MKVTNDDKARESSEPLKRHFPGLAADSFTGAATSLLPSQTFRRDVAAASNLGIQFTPSRASTFALHCLLFFQLPLENSASRRGGKIADIRIQSCETTDLPVYNVKGNVSALIDMSGNRKVIGRKPFERGSKYVRRSKFFA